jgi:NitT/TauT family transport system substrate-binding protein
MAHRERRSEGWRKTILVAMLLVFVFGTAIPSYSQPAAKKQVVLALQWIPQAQFAGYYMAYEKGIYDKYGIDLRFVHGGPGTSSLELVKQGKADFATDWLTSALQQWDNGAPLLNLAQIIQKSGLMLIAKKTSGITKPEDLDGKRIGLWGGDFSIPARALFRRYQAQVEEIPQSASMNLFLRGAIDVASAMLYNEYHLVLNSGLDPTELNTFLFSDYQLNFPEDGIYCLQNTYDQDPVLCRAMVKASLEGWQYAFDYPEEATDVVMRYASAVHTGTNRVHQKWMLAKMAELIVPAGDPLEMGTLQPADLGFVSLELLRAGLIQKQPNYQDFCIPPTGNP